MKTNNREERNPNPSGFGIDEERGNKAEEGGKREKEMRFSLSVSLFVFERLCFSANERPLLIRGDVGRYYWARVLLQRFHFSPFLNHYLRFCHSINIICSLLEALTYVYEYMKFSIRVIDY